MVKPSLKDMGNEFTQSNKCLLDVLDKTAKKTHFTLMQLFKSTLVQEYVIHCQMIGVLIFC